MSDRNVFVISTACFLVGYTLLLFGLICSSDVVFVFMADEGGYYPYAHLALSIALITTGVIAIRYGRIVIRRRYPPKGGKKTGFGRRGPV
jgi:hypothetical protein